LVRNTPNTRGGKKYKIEIYNVYGEKVYSTSNIKPQTSNKIDLSSQPSGIYFLNIKLSEAKSVSRGSEQGTANMEHPTWRKKLIINK
jgi:hypothetical protein